MKKMFLGEDKKQSVLLMYQAHSQFGALELMILSVYDLNLQIFLELCASQNSGVTPSLDVTSERFCLHTI